MPFKIIEMLIYPMSQNIQHSENNVKRTELSFRVNKDHQHCNHHYPDIFASLISTFKRS